MWNTWYMIWYQINFLILITCSKYCTICITCDLNSILTIPVTMTVNVPIKLSVVLFTIVNTVEYGIRLSPIRAKAGGPNNCRMNVGLDGALRIDRRARFIRQKRFGHTAWLYYVIYTLNTYQYLLHITIITISHYIYNNRKPHTKCSATTSALWLGLL
jgi:hypothetical protein